MNWPPSQSRISQLKAHQVTTFVFYKIYFNLTEDVHSNFRNDSNNRGQPRARTNRNTHHGRQRQKQASLDLKEMEELRATVKTAKTESNAFKQMAFLFFCTITDCNQRQKEKSSLQHQWRSMYLQRKCEFHWWNILWRLWITREKSGEWISVWITAAFKRRWPRLNHFQKQTKSVWRILIYDKKISQKGKSNSS